jgi:hypothetical protein
MYCFSKGKLIQELHNRGDTEAWWNLEAWLYSIWVEDKLETRTQQQDG